MENCPQNQSSYQSFDLADMSEMSDILSKLILAAAGVDVRAFVWASIGSVVVGAASSVLKRLFS